MPSSQLENFNSALLELVNKEDVANINAIGFSKVLQSRMDMNEGDFVPSTYETSLLGGGLPDYINPLQVEKNLNVALDLVGIIDGLLGEYSQRISVQLMQNHIKSQLKASEDEEARDIHSELSKTLSKVEGQRALEYRIATNFIDLVEYSKAAKFGLKLVYDVNGDDYEDEYSDAAADIAGLRRIRETLRNALKAYRRVSLQMQRSTIAVSLKYSPVDQEPKGWKVDRRSGLPHNNLSVDLEETSFFEDYRGARINAIGVQVFDKSSGFRNFYPKGEKSFSWSTPRQAYWDITLVDKSDGVDLGNQRRFRIGDTMFPAVPGSRDAQDVTWSGNQSLENVSPARKWSLEFKQNSVDGQAKSHILDVVLFFDVSFLN